MRPSVADAILRPVLGLAALLVLLFAAAQLLGGIWALVSPTDYQFMQSSGERSLPTLSRWVALGWLLEGLVAGLAGGWLLWRACHPIFARHQSNPALERTPLAEPRWF